MKIRPGRIFWKDDQRYEIIGPKDHITKDGRFCSMVIYESRCADCGCTFRGMASPRSIAARQVNRRCDEHKRPGTPVVSRRGVALKPPAPKPTPAQLRQQRAARRFEMPIRGLDPRPKKPRRPVAETPTDRPAEPACAFNPSPTAAAPSAPSYLD